MRLVVPLEMPDMKGGMLQSVELLLRFLPDSVEKIALVPRASGIIDRIKATGTRVICSAEDRFTVNSVQPLKTARTFITFQRELRPLLTRDTIVLTNSTAS